MRSMACCVLGFAMLGLFADSTCLGQTELSRFSPPPGVVVFRSTDPLPVPPAALPIAPAVPVTVGYPAEVSVYSVPVPEPFTTPSTLGPGAVEPPVTATPWESVTTTNYAPATPNTVYSPVTPPVVVSDWTPVNEPASVTVYRPILSDQPAGVPQTAVVPAPTSIPLATPIPVGPVVTVRPKVYIQGQPIRNFFRAVTP
jgi:hypothetical protein